MLLQFSKYHGTGNDFILIDNRNNVFQNQHLDHIKHLCHRRFGIGADGLILLQKKAGYDFEMIYFNADGNPSSMCGNGGRCIVSYAHKLGLIKERASFLAVDGTHEAELISYDTNTNIGMVSLKMSDVDEIERNEGFYFLNTGSPHYVTFVKDVSVVNVNEEGKKIRNSTRFIKDGTNVNFVEEGNESIVVRTYERGVEEETFSCGTGVTASALVAGMKQQEINDFKVKTPGGELHVFFEKNGNGFKNIYLQGQASFVFDGSIEI